MTCNRSEEVNGAGRLRCWIAVAVFAIPLLMGSGVAAMAQSPHEADGKSLAFDKSKGNCLSCHDIKGSELPGTIGPQLKDMKSRFPDRNDLVAIIRDETKRNPQTVMPPFGRNLILDDREINAIVDFLYTL